MFNCHQNVMDNHQERKGPPLAMMLIGTPKLGLSVHIHQWT
jgi:hypothetical protein